MKINFKYNGTLYDVIVKFGYFFLLILSLYITIATLFCGMEPTPATQGGSCYYCNELQCEQIVLSLIFIKKNDIILL